MTNNMNIPNDAIATEIYLTETGNGASWLGFYKVMMAYGQNIRFPDKAGQVNVMYQLTSENQDTIIYVKQPWLFGGYVTQSNNFIWYPEIRFDYMYPMTISNLQYFE